MTVTIRALDVTTDMADWRRMRFTLWPHYNEPDMEIEIRDVLATIDRQPVYVAVVPDGSLCGLMETNIRPWAEGCATDRVGYLEAWYVDPAWRRYGIGRRLVEAAEAWARAQGCTEMASDTDDGYPISPQAHGRLGYIVVKTAPNEICFAKRLVPEPPQ